MPRIKHTPVPGAVCHLISRFVNGEPLMVNNSYRAEYLNRLERALSDTDWRLLWFALMQTHTHLGLVAGKDPLNKWLIVLHTGFAVWLNLNGRRKGLRTRGPVFAGRPLTLNFSDESAGYLAAYIHNNPVRARLVKSPSNSTWTSHRAYLGLDPRPKCLDVKRGLEITGNEDTATGRLAFHEFVLSRIGDDTCRGFAVKELAKVRESLRDQLSPAVELCSPTIDKTSVHYDFDVPRGICLRRNFRGTPDQVLHLVAELTGVSTKEIRGRARNRAVVRARRVAVLAWRRLDRSLVEMSAAMSISRPAATWLIQHLDLSDPDIEILVSRILNALTSSQ
jgi:hypothetical protein